MTQTEYRAPHRPEPGSGGRARAWRHHARANRAAAGRMSWGLVDQAVSSMTNFAVGLYVARSLGAAEFGMFSLAWVTFSVVLNMSRGLATDPLVVRFSGVGERAWRKAVGLASGMALSVGIGVGALCLLAGGMIGGQLGSAFVALGIVLPWLTLQDSWRYAFFAAGQGGRSVANDLVWGVALIPAMAIATQFGTVFAFILAWGLAAAVAAGFGCLQTRLLPHSAGGSAWLRQHRDLGPRYMVENVSLSAASMLRMYGLGAIAGLTDVGAIRGADLLLAPLVAVLMGVCLVAVPEAARVLQRRPHRLFGFCLALGGAQAIAALTWGLALVLLLPDAVGRWVLPSLWESASVLIVPAALTATGVGMANGASTGLRALGASRRSLRAQLVSAGFLVTFGLIGAVLGGALGSAWGAALAATVGAAVSWTQLRAGLRELGAGNPDTPARAVTHEEARVDGEDTPWQPRRG